MKYLSIYLNDHYAGSTSGLELAKRAARNNRRDPQFGPPLQRLAGEIEEDRKTLLRLMARLDVDVDRIKTGLGWALEKAGRIKLNGEILRFSPLSRLVEIEGLLTGVSGKLSLWRVLLDVESAYEPLDAAELSALAERAEDQRLRLYALRGHAAASAFIS